MEDCRISESRLQLTLQLGEGAFSKVYRGIYQNDAGELVPVAVKLFKASNNAKMFERELEIRHMHHENIVKIFGWFQDGEGHTGLVMELCALGSVEDLLRREPTLPNSVRVDILRQAAQGLLALHKERRMVRDIKLANLLVSEQVEKKTVRGTAKYYKVKLTDFGLSRKVYDFNTSGRGGLAQALQSAVHSTNTPGNQSGSTPAGQPEQDDTFALTAGYTVSVGTPLLLAPEQFGKDYTESVDIWMFGFMILELFGQTTDPDVVRCDDFGFNKKSLVHMDIPQGVKDVVLRCCAPPKERISASQLCDALILLSKLSL